MNHLHTTVFRIAALIAAIALCCSFSRGLGKSDPCEKARTTLDALSSVTISAQYHGCPRIFLQPYATPNSHKNVSRLSFGQFEFVWKQNP